MKFFAAVTALLCLVHVNAKVPDIFTPGYQYRYLYEAQALTSMADSSQTAAIAHKGSVVVANMRNNIYVMIERMKSARLNEVLFTEDFEKIPYEFTEFGNSVEKLYTPVKVFYDRGLITAFETDSTESDEITNIKKAILTLLQLKLDQFYKEYDQEKPAKEQFSTYDVLEDGIAGKCVTTYVVESNPWAGRPEENVLNVTKVKDYEDCVREPVMTFSSHAPNNCSDCDSDDFDPVDSTRVTNYEIRNMDNMFVIERIENFMTTVFIPFTSKGDSMQTNHSQVLILKEVKPVDLSFPQVTAPERQEDLQYDFPLVDYDESSEEELLRQPIQFLPLEGKSYPNEVLRLLDEVTSEIVNSHKVPILHTPYKAQQLARAMRSLSKEQLESALGLIEPSKRGEDLSVRRRLIFDTVLMCGTLPCLQYLLEKVETGVIESFKAAEILAAVPFYIRRPTAPFIKRFLQVCEKIPQKGSQLHSSCWLAFGSLVDQSCGPEETNVPTSPGVETYCTEENEKQYVQAVWRQLEADTTKELRLIYLQTLGIMGLDDIVQVVKPYATGDIQVSEMVRVKALYALKEVDEEEVFDEIIDIIKPLVINTEESTIVRTAALHVMMELDKHPHFMERLATLTWDDDDDDQFVNMIYSMFDSYANATYPCYKNDSRHAINALSFSQEQDISIQDSQYNIYDFYDEEYMLGSLFESSFIANNDSFFPRKLWFNFERSIAGFTQSPFESSIHIEGLDSIIKRLIGPNSIFEKLSLKDIFSRNYEKPPMDFHNLFTKLNIDPRVDEELAVSIWVNFLTSQHRHFYFDSQTILHYLQRGFPHFDLFSPSGMKVDYQKTLNLGYVKHQIPSALGLPIYVGIKSPAIIDMKGHLSVIVPPISEIINNPYNPIVVKVKCDVRPTVSFNLMTTMGIVDPFKKLGMGVGVTSETYLSIPHEFSMELDVTEAKLTASLKPASRVMATPDVTLFRYVVKPFTVIYPYDKFALVEKYIKPILSDQTPEEYEYRIGNEVIGLPAKLLVKSDVFWQDQGSFLKYFFEENNPISLLSLWWATPDFSYREYIFTMDSQAAASTKLSLMVDVDYIPSKIQEIFRQGQKGFKGMLNYWLGWTKMPYPCELLDREYPDDLESPSASSSKFRKFSYDEEEEATYKPSRSYDDDDGEEYMKTRKRPSYFDDEVTIEPTSMYRYPKQHDFDYEEEHDVKRKSKSRHQRSVSEDEIVIKKIPFTIENAENAVNIKVEAVVSGNVQRTLKSNIHLVRNVVQLTDRMEIKTEISNPAFTPDNQLKICAKGHMKYPKLPCGYSKSLNPDFVKPITSRLEISYGEQCGAKKLSISSEYTKTPEQIESEKKAEDWMFTQCKKDAEENRKWSSACDEALIAVGDLKRTVYNIEYQFDELPRWLVNASYKAENFFKYYFYNQMSDNFVDVSNEEGKLKIITEFDVDDPVIDIQVLKPRENLFLEDIYYPEVSGLIRPLNARLSAVRLDLDDLTGGYAPPTCKVMGNYVETFDNETIQVPLTTCKHVITKDCSPSDLFSVLMSKDQNGKGKELELQLLRHRIVARLLSPGKFEVVIDKQQQILQTTDPILMLSHTHPDSKGVILASIQVNGPYLLIKAAHHGLWIKFDGENAKISLSNIWRGDVCGLCSEFDGDSSSTLIDPQQCEYANLKDFLMSYYVPSTHCDQIKPSPRRICPKADISPSSYRPSILPQDDDDDDDDNFSTTTTFFNDDDDDDDDDDVQTQARSADFPPFSGTILRNKLIQRNGKECFTVEPLPECKPGSYPSESAKRLVGFTCPRNPQFLRELKKYRGQRPLRELTKEKVEFREVVSYPLTCTRRV